MYRKLVFREFTYDDVYLRDIVILPHMSSLFSEDETTVPLSKRKDYWPPKL